MADASSDLARGFKFGVGCALGFSFILFLFLFGMSMCAGRIHQRVREEMQEMIPKERPSLPEQPDEIL
jgi:hypothetical protein